MFPKCLLRTLVLSSLAVLLTLPAVAVTRTVVPAGTILDCTLDEPNFSYKTAMVNDPVLCHLGPLRSFGRQVFPRGAELSGYLRDMKKPGYWGGKGWMSFEFDRLVLPNADILPMSSKVISVPKKLKVNAQGEIHGGQYPVLKGETRISLRLMDDLEVSYPVATRDIPMPPWSQSYRPSSYSPVQREMPRVRVVTAQLDSMAQGPAEEFSPAPTAPVQAAAGEQPSAIQPTSGEPRITVLALRNGTAALARDYWVQHGEVHYISENGQESTFNLADVDLYRTAEVNRERHVDFVLESREISEQ